VPSAINLHAKLHRQVKGTHITTLRTITAHQDLF